MIQFVGSVCKKSKKIKNQKKKPSNRKQKSHKKEETMSEESEDRVPSKEEFDKLFFSKRHVLLEAVVRTVCALFNTFSDNNNAT